MAHHTFSENAKALGYFISKSILPNATLAKLGVVLGGISVIALLQHALKFGFADVMAVIIRWYDTFLAISLGWLRTPLEKLMEWVLSRFQIDVDIKPHWKHIFVVTNVYFLRNTFTYTRTNVNKKIERDFPATFIVASLSLVFSLLVAGFSGMVVADSAINNFLIAWVPLIGFFLYDLIERFFTVLVLPPKEAYSKFGLTKAQAFRKYTQWAFERFVATSGLSLVLTAAIALSKPSATLEYGVLVFLVCTSLLAIYWVSGRASIGYQHLEGDHHLPVIARLMKHSGTTYLGAMMLGTLIWGGIFTLLNAGLGLVGL